MRARELLRRLDDTEVARLTSAGLAAAIAGQVRTGQLPAGLDLPSERDLATVLGRSRGTVARAYEQLRSEGLAHTRQGAGTTIGCCAGPWASSRAAELDPIAPVAAGPAPRVAGRAIDLRALRWPAELTGPVAEVTGPVADPLRPPPEALAVESRIRALDVVLTTLLRPGERVLVPSLTDPRLLALLRVRGLHAVALPVDPDGRADLPAWLQRLRSRAASVALLAAAHAPPAGASLAAHERQLLVEAAATGEVTLVGDRSWDPLWLDAPPPPALAELATDERTVSLGAQPASLPAEVPGAPVDGTAVPASAGPELAWIHTPSAALRERFAAVAVVLDAAPDPSVLAVPALVDLRRQHLIEHTATTIRLVTPVAPRVRVAPATGGPLRLLHLDAVPGSVVADAARERGVLVHPGAACAVADADISAVAVSLTGPTPALVTGLRVLLEVVDELA